MRCAKCKTDHPLEGKKLSFRAICEKCDSDLHSCINCCYYSPGKPNDCEIPDTLPIRDRERYNFCEDFRPKEDVEKKENSSSRAHRLLGKGEEKKDFDSLFQ